MRVSAVSQLTWLITTGVLIIGAGCDWGDLEGIPAGFADGVDDQVVAGTGLTDDGAGTISVVFEGEGSGLGSADTVARSDHDHDADYVLKAGDTMTGPLVLAADPAGALEAATKQYVDSTTMPSGTDNWVDTAGDTMTGDLTINTDLTVNGIIEAGSAYSFGVYNKIGTGTPSSGAIGNNGDLYVTYDIEAGAQLFTASNVNVGGNLLLGGSSSTDDDTIYFDTTTNEYLNWDDSEHEFVFSDELKAASFKYSTARTSYASVAPSAFQPYEDGYDYVSAVGSAYFVSGAGSLYAPIQLPHGAVVTELRAFILDLDPAQHVEVLLYRKNLFAGSDVMATAETTDADVSGAVVSRYDDTIAYATIDNASNAYALRAIFDGANTSLRGVRVKYTVTTPMP